jgi:hypothetical protein
MNRLAIYAVMFVTLSACGSETEPPKASIPIEEEVTKEAATNVSDVLTNKGPKWKVDYSGDLTGSVEGGILTATSAGTGSMTSALGKAMKSDLRGSAPQALQVNFMASQTEERFANVNLTLADGTKCKSDIKKLSRGEVTNPDPKAFTAEVPGELLCGDAKDKRISYSATLAK